MELQLDNKKYTDFFVTIATPMYGGQCFGSYVEGILKLQEMFFRYGIKHKFSFMYNESLITRARTFIAEMFLREKDSTHLLFIDSDIQFNALDIIAMLTLTHDRPDEMSIVCGPYVKKSIAWNNIKRAVDLGLADKDPEILGKYVGSYVFNVVPGTDQLVITEPVEVLESGTGMMLIRRKVFEDFRNAYPEMKFMPNSPPSFPSGPGNECTLFFDTEIDPESLHYLSEDYMFCRRARAIGHKVWLCPWMKTKHTGTYEFYGSMESLAELNPEPSSKKKGIKV